MRCRRFRGTFLVQPRDEGKECPTPTNRKPASQVFLTTFYAVPASGIARPSRFARRNASSRASGGSGAGPKRSR